MTNQKKEMNMKKKELLDRVRAMYHAGYSAEEISNAIGLPSDQVQSWINMIRHADQKK